MKDKNKIKKITIGVVIAFVLCMVGIGVAYRSYSGQTEKYAVKMEELAQKVVATEAVECPTQPETEKGTGATDTQEEGGYLRHDFFALAEENKDIYAWIQMPDTKVDYPVLQSEEDNRYLDTNIDGTKGYPGCIYSNKCNSKEFTDYITVLYGHNMKSGDMFGTLDYFYEEDFFDNYGTYTVETPEACRTYSVYAAVNYNDKLIPAYYDVKSSAGRDEFVKSLEECKGNSKTYFNDAVEISGEDKVLVLSVCISGQDDRRYLIVSKLEEVQNYQ